MTTTCSPLRLALACYLLLAQLCYANPPQQLTWADLAPKPAAPANPFPKLTKQQLLTLSDIATIRERKARGETISPIDLEDEQSGTRRLTQQGLDVDALLALRKDLAEQRKASTLTMNTALNGQTVRIPGYLLPLEFSGKMVTEFLLVPSVGACIHTPPPPPNQIVHVKAGKPVEFHGLFAPIWVTGQLTATRAKKSLYLVDGASDIDVGYAIDASAVEPYKE